MDKSLRSLLYRSESKRLSTSLEAMYGEISEHSLYKIIQSIQEFGMNSESVFLDLGSGRGVPNIVFSSIYSITASIGK